jgi:hypothetical protein
MPVTCAVAMTAEEAAINIKAAARLMIDFLMACPLQKGLSVTGATSLGLPAFNNFSCLP